MPYWSLFIILADDNTFSYWNATIFAPNERIYDLKMFVGEQYPNEPPEISFVSKINMVGVNQTNGKVDNSTFSVLKYWNKNNTIAEALKGIRKEMETQAFKKLSQPPEGTLFK